MKNLKEKKGISLIVLIITIIVMIILAAAIILSLNNSGIIDRANQAKTDSDTANLKEYVNVLMAEWEMMTPDERETTNCNSSIAYVNKMLEEKGYKRRLNEDSILLMENTIEALKDGIQIGDVVNYEVTSKTEESKQVNNGASDQDVSNQTNLIWRYIGISDNGEIMIAPDITSDAPKVGLSGKTGYLKGPDELHRLCKELYSTTKGTARSMTIEDVDKLVEYNNPDVGFNHPDKNPYLYFGRSFTEYGETLVVEYYWYYLANVTEDLRFEGYPMYYICCVEGDVENIYLFCEGDQYCSSRLRPVVCIKPEVQLVQVSANNWDLN